MKFISLLIALVMVVPLFQGTYTSQCPKSKEKPQFFVDIVAVE